MYYGMPIPRRILIPPLLLLLCGVLLGAVLPVRAVPPRQPDLWIRNSSETSYSGINVFSSDGLNQTKAQNVLPGQTAVFLYRLSNDCGTANSFTVTAAAGNNAFTVQYFLTENNANITTQMASASGIVLGPIAPHDNIGFYEKVTPASTTAPGAAFTSLITAIPVIITGRMDAVQSVVNVISPWVYQPDLWIRNSMDSSYSGIGVFSSDGINQQKAQTVMPGKTATYLFRLANAGNTADSFTFMANSNNPDSTVRFFRTDTGQEISAQVFGNGYPVGPLAPNTNVGFFATVTTLAGSANAVTNLLVVTTSQSHPASADAVRAITTADMSMHYQPDLWIRNPTDTSYTGVGIFSASGQNETVTQTITNGGTTCYLAQLVNDGDTADSFVLTGTAGSSLWTIRYFKCDTGNELTTSISGNGLTTATLKPGQKMGILLEVTSHLTAQSRDTINVTLSAASAHASGKIDEVHANTLSTP